MEPSINLAGQAANALGHLLVGGMRITVVVNEVDVLDGSVVPGQAGCSGPWVSPSISSNWASCEPTACSERDRVHAA